MKSWLVKRIITMLVVVWGVVTLTFFLMRFCDGDPATIIALDRYGNQLISPDVIAELAAREGLTQPVYRQYLNWLRMAGQGQFGNSLRSGTPVMTEIRERFPYTLRLAIWTIMFTALIAIPCGVLAACRPEGWFDRLSRLFAAVNVSIPNFYLALVLILIFSIHLRWLPSFGAGDVRHIVLPLTVLVLSQVGFTLRVVRAAVIRILASEHVRYARLRGLTRRRILTAHVLKNALLPIITYLSLQFLMVVEGSIIVESVFAWPGIGKLFQEAVMGRDFTMIQALVLLSGVFVVLTSFATDLGYMLINRRLGPVLK